MVSFVGPDKRVFQGALLDSKKGNIPFGINPTGYFNKKLDEDNPRDYDPSFVSPSEESFPILSRRHTYYQDKSDKPPVIVPSGKNGRSFLSQDKKLSVRLRARQVLCSRCSSICTERGENVRDSKKDDKKQSQIETNANPKITKPKPKAEVKDLHPKTKTLPCASSNDKKPRKRVRYFGAKKRKFKKKVLVAPAEVTNESLDDLDDRSKRLAKRNSLVPKVRRLAQSEIERYSEPSNSDKESCSDTEKYLNKGPPTLSRLSSTESGIQPALRIKFSNLQSSSKHYSIVNSIEDQDSRDSAKRSSDEDEIQPLKKVQKKDSLEKEKTAPVLKISFGESGVMTVSSAGNDHSDDDTEEEQDDNKLATTVSMKANSASSKAAKKALKKAKKEAQRRSMRLSPGHPYMGGKSPHNLANYSPHRYSLPSPSTIYRPSLTSPAASGSLSPGNQPFSSVSPSCSSRFSSPAHQIGSASPAYTLLCPSSQKIIIKKVKKKKRKDKTRDIVDLDQTPCSSTDCMVPAAADHVDNDYDCDEFQEVDNTIDSVGDRPGLTVESAQLVNGHTLCVGDVVWAKVESNPWWPAKVVKVFSNDKSHLYCSGSQSDVDG